MRHFHDLDQAVRERLFARPPQWFDRHARLETLAGALGATLYMPATRLTLSQDLLRQGAAGVMSCVVCLEDAIPDDMVAAAQTNVVAQLRTLAAHGDDAPVPLVFIRVRHVEQIPAIVGALGEQLPILSGFVLPKFTDLTGDAYLDAIEDAALSSGQRLLAMPVIESPDVIYRESRQETLIGTSRLLAKHRESVLAVRIGATDLCAAYGIRRSPELTVYDVGAVADVIYDVVNILGRSDGSGFTVTGPVWEYFPNRDRLFKPQLRQSPFEARQAPVLRHQLITSDMDGLLREIVLDKANGLIGKTVIHPSHVAAVHALSVVTYEEYADATDVLGQHDAGGGVLASRFGNKMNEAKPHFAWAERIMARAAVFGVAAEDVNFVDLLAAREIA
ncbi:MAG: HpcH/HpaI aldolase/citrate lyase family protein [Actinomycetota bacterium]